MPSAKKILIVDDSDAVRAVIRNLLVRSSDLHVCGEAADGVDAIEKARELKPDVVLLDLAMPKLNGAAAASVLRKLLPRMRIIVFTMYEDAVGTLAAAVGVDLVVSKPDGIHNLVQKVHNLLDACYAVDRADLA
jgi:DNA-binding NarL/FixJ family response regulator